MIDAEATYDEIQQLPLMAAGIRLKEPNALAYLRAVYLKVTGETVVAGCKGCHLKAAHYLSTLTIQKLKEMLNKEFKLKENVSLEYPFRSGTYHTAKTLTDATARQYLTDYPEGVKYFEEYPKDADSNLQVEEQLTADNLYKEDGKYFSADGKKVTAAAIKKAGINEDDIKDKK